MSGWIGVESDRQPSRIVVPSPPWIARADRDEETGELLACAECPGEPVAYWGRICGFDRIDDATKWAQEVAR